MTASVPIFQGLTTKFLLENIQRFGGGLEPPGKR